MIQNNISLKKYNTFGIDVKAKYLTIIDTKEALINLLPELKKQPFLFLGCGSNILFTQDFEGLVVINNIKGKSIEIIDNQLIAKGFSGENWHEFVQWTLQNNAFGLENLSLIPGSLGAAPMQNIGAYGSEIKQNCKEVIAINLDNGNIETFTNDTCQFGYRESVFKRALKCKYFILEVSFTLQKPKNWLPNANYGDIEKILETKNIKNPNANDIAEAVIEIRQSKLPDPKKLGNSGSFFKNPVIVKEKFNQFISKNENALHYILSENEIKIPAGWLIEQAGFKGKKFGNCGVHEKQALVLVNYGKATGREIFDLSEIIINTVKEKFDIELEREVNVY
jgi:UDP-N-acetylmuramate dehydrogenase